MYNRYVPQADGSYRRNRMEEAKHQRPVEQKAQHRHENAAQQETCLPQPSREHSPHQGKQIGGFLRQLLPKDFDTADLIIVLLLLLLAGDCEEDRNTAMLTLVLYLFM